MRINKYIASNTKLSRRSVDQAIAEGRVSVNDKPATFGQDINEQDKVYIDDKLIKNSPGRSTIMLHKPVGYVVSRDGQGSKTIYNLLPKKYHLLNPVGRLDKNSSGLLLLTNNGRLAQKLTHPSFQKKKVYEVELNKALLSDDIKKLKKGVLLDDGLSQLGLKPLSKNSYTVIIKEGRNRQIRRSFSVLGYTVTKLHRVKFGDYTLKNLKVGKVKLIS